MKTEKERYEVPTIQIVDVQTGGMLCTSLPMLLLTVELFDEGDGLGRDNYTGDDTTNPF